MVRSRDVVQVEGSARPGRAPWRRGSGGAPAGSATWCCGCCVAHRWRRCPVRRAWRSTGSKRGGSGPWLASNSAYRIVTASQWRRCSTRRSGTSGSCRWRSSCSARGRGPRSSASLWRCGGRDDERDDLRGDGAMFRHPAGVVRSGSARARRSTRGGRGHTTGWARGRRGGGRRRGNRTRSCWRRFGPISLGPRSTAKAIARSPHGFGSWTGSESPARGCCASCGRTDCSPRTAGVRAPRRPTTGGSSCSAPGFLDSGLTVFASTRPRLARRGRVAPARGFGSRTSPASSARCTSA